MRVISCKATNFASYKELEFYFDKQGLTLIHGLTGSGKSTLCDLIPWILFGKTAIGGTVDEILSWPGDTITQGSIVLALSEDKREGSITICRRRSKSSKENDLSWWHTGSYSIVANRGSALGDTQKMINNLLGMDYELYLSGAYFHEFSQTAQFFTTTAKNRRVICEQLVNLSMPKKLQDNIKDSLKDVYTSIDSFVLDMKVLESNLKTLSKAQLHEHNKAAGWSILQSARISQAQDRVLKFEDSRALKVEQLINRSADRAKSKTCSECGAIKTSTEHKHQYSNLEIMRIENEENPYVTQLQDLTNQENPHNGGMKDFSDEIAATNAKINYYTKQLDFLRLKQSDLDILQGSTQQFRSLLIKNTILDVEYQTNILLSNHFDSEIKIELIIEDSDKLEVIIQKDSNTCSYTQLSKGQRQMLKLCFGIAVMKAVSNHHGISFNQMFFDEACDGMDDNTKIRAIKMLETLTLNCAVYVVEHSSEVKAMVNNKYKVELINGNSMINAET